MIRFVLRRKFRDAISGAEVDNQIFTIDAEVPSLERELRRGGYGEYGYEIIELVGAEVLNPKDDDDDDSVSVSLSRIRQREQDNPMLYSDTIKVANELERVQRAIRQLAADHPDTPVSYPCNGKTHYQEIRDWANHVLGGEHE